MITRAGDRMPGSRPARRLEGGRVGALLVVAAALAGCAPSSRDACESYWLARRDLPCAEPSVVRSCSADEDACDRAPYWACREAHTTCTDAGLVDDAAACDPTCAP